MALFVEKSWCVLKGFQREGLAYLFRFYGTHTVLLLSEGYLIIV